MAKPHLLNINTNDFDFVLLGLSLIKDQYETAFALNETLNLKLALSHQFQLSLKGHHQFRFSLFRYFDETFGIEYLLIPNASNFEVPKPQMDATDLFQPVIEVEERSLLVRELPKTDYFLILKGEDVQVQSHKLLPLIRKIPDLLAVSLIDVLELPSRNNLVF